MRDKNPHLTKMIAACAVIDAVAAAAVTAVLLTLAYDPHTVDGWFIAAVMVVIFLVDRLNSFMARFGDPVNGADYTGIFIVFATLVMGPLAGIAVVVFENLYFFAKSFVLRKNRYKTGVEHWLINSHNFASSFVSVFIAHFVVLLVGHESWVLMVILPVVTIVADIFQLKFFGTLRLLLSLYRGTELPPRQQKIALLRDMANSYMYYIYIAFGPILLYFSYTQNGLAGLILALIILIPSQATGLLYMQLKDKQAELFTDELTGINNSMKFRTDMENLLSKPEPYVLVMFDLDEFKKVNDQYGHLFGNEALILFSKLISGFTDNRAGSCKVYRLHGDEFVMLIPNVSRASEIIDRLNNLISSYAIDYQGGLVKLSFSGGAALVPPGTPARDALQQADIVLYKAKSAGRGRVLFEENVSLP